MPQQIELKANEVSSQFLRGGALWDRGPCGPHLTLTEVSNKNWRAGGLRCRDCVMTEDPSSLLNTRSVCPPLGSWASPRDAYGTRRAPAMDSQKSPESAPSVPPRVRVFYHMAQVT